MFELTSSGRLLTGDQQCITVHGNSYMAADACSPALSGQQRWSYDERSGHLLNPWSGFCAMHVTDPADTGDGTRRWRQVVMAQNCTVDLSSGRVHDNSTAPFMRWTFTNP